MSFYLGLDVSTQSVTAMLVEIAEDVRRVVYEHAFRYDEALPHYHTTHGVLHGPGSGVVSSPPVMWMEAMDLMVARLTRERPREMANLAAVAGSAQQHASVYLDARGVGRLARLDSAAPLAMQMANAFSRSVAPVWMDSSTASECREIAAALGGDDVVTARTGSRMFERFTGPQVRRFYKREPRAYGATSRVHLVSSFLASVLSGADAPVDPGDASGTNLMDLASSRWWPEALEATAPDLSERLPHIAPATTIVGSLAPYWRERHGLPPAHAVIWSGDNPSSLIGTGLVREGRLGISLGTSDTVFGLMRTPRVDESRAGSVFGAPTGDFMGITVFRNGSLARERVRDQFGMNWQEFSAALRSTPPGNGGALMLPWFEPEITPEVLSPSVHARDLPPANAAASVRAVVEAQMMSMANHSRWLGADIHTIHATGGSSENLEVLQVMANVFGADVYRFESNNSACLGAAIRACHADRLLAGQPINWDDAIAGLAEPQAQPIRPNPKDVVLYRDLRRTYAAFEAQALERTS